MTTRRETIEARLVRDFQPAELTVEDESHLHEGHGGWREGGQTHFRVAIVSEAFAGKSRVERHRMVNQALAEEFAGGMHALAVLARAPGD